MMTTLSTSTRYELNRGTLIQAQAIAHLTLLVLDLSRDEPTSMNVIRTASEVAKTEPEGPAGRVAIFAAGLLPPDALARIGGRAHQIDG